MGVSHLGKHQRAAAGAASANSGSADSRNLSTPLSTRYAPNSGANNVPKVGGVSGYSKEALRGGKASQPEHGGARAGRKSGQPNIGAKGSKPGMSGGRLG